MEIEIEIENEGTKTSIRNELGTFFNSEVLKASGCENSRIIVPMDFQQTIIKYENNPSYRQYRGIGNQEIKVLAKHISQSNHDIFVFSLDNFFSDNQDFQTRLFTYAHELKHAINKRFFPIIKEEFNERNYYLGNLYTIFDEYTADLFSYNINDDVFPQKSDIWKNNILSFSQGLINIIDDNTHYQGIKEQISEFRDHGDTLRFYKNIWQYLNEITTSITHAFSISTHFNNYIDFKNFQSPKFINDKTLKLLDFIKDKENNSIYELSDGYHLAIDFFTNFGFRLEDQLTGTYMHVVDI